LPAIRSISKLPLAISFRKPAAVSEPSGKAMPTAIASRKGVEGVIFSGSGRRAFIDFSP
jgi:hypothetical protein